ncbi:MAG: hypothetical protein LBI79_06060 [Nitrososphaerota archaeon]|jgi:hypothetical protein|nr:hypothetical protein [Nitrososphaerota archaeon]
MDLAKRSSDAEGCWVEVRPLITSELEAANFAPVLDALYNFAKPYRFLMVNTKDRKVSERQQVRFYLQFSDEPTRKQMSNIIQTLSDVEVVTATSPEQHYTVSVDLELAKNYALPIVVVNGQQGKVQVNLIDRIVASIAVADACIEITSQADPNAALGVQKFVYEKVSRKTGLSKTGLDPFADLIGAAVGKDPPSEVSRGKSVPYKMDPWVRECVKNAELKLASNLFTCKIIIKANSLGDILAVKNALPSAMNRFRVFKTEKKSHQQVSALRRPSRYGLRNNVLCRLWWIVPLSILLFAGGFGLFNPLMFISSVFSVDLVFLVLAGFFAVGLFVAFRKRHPIVLSIYELAQIVGLPSAVEKLPVALGKVPISRMQLDFEEGAQEGAEESSEEEESKSEKPSGTQEEEADCSELSQEIDELTIPHLLALEDEQTLV